MTEENENWGALSDLPGNPLMWVLIISELAVFGAFFLAFEVARLLHPDVFMAGQSGLDVRLGGLNTLFLVSSGYLAARGVHAGAAAWRWFCGASLLGVAFLVVKCIEYGHKFAQGFGLESDVFHTLFFLMTGFHAMHVVLGLIILAIVAWKNTPANLETGAAFWHMVDLIWLILFPLVYLLR